MITIFDFNRTLYEPDTGELVDGAQDVLDALTQAGFELHLISKKEEGREDTLARLGVASLFRTTTFTEHKRESMKSLIEGAEGTVYVIGDHLHNEIRIGNELGAKTIWLKRGKFMGLMPESEKDVPWRTVEDLKEVTALILD